MRKGGRASTGASGFRLQASGPSPIHARNEHRAGRSAVRVLKSAAGRFLADLGLEDRELSILVVGDRAIRALNKQWRGKDQPTDVLSFGLTASRKPLAASRKRAAAAGQALGDVVISLDTARRQAKEGGWPLSVELRRLLAHGLLHCLGHDHEQPGQARKMARAERSLLGAEGMVGAAFSTELKSGPRSRSL